MFVSVKSITAWIIFHFGVHKYKVYLGVEEKLLSCVN
jgi:hypothetical protein